MPEDFLYKTMTAHPGTDDNLGDYIRKTPRKWNRSTYGPLPIPVTVSSRETSHGQQDPGQQNVYFMGKTTTQYLHAYDVTEKDYIAHPLFTPHELSSRDFMDTLKMTCIQYKTDAEGKPFINIAGDEIWIPTATITKAQPDNNCGFRSLSLVRYGTQNLHAEIREEINEYMIKEIKSQSNVGEYLFYAWFPILPYDKTQEYKDYQKKKNNTSHGQPCYDEAEYAARRAAVIALLHERKKPVPPKYIMTPENTWKWCQDNDLIAYTLMHRVFIQIARMAMHTAPRKMMGHREFIKCDLLYQLRVTDIIEGLNVDHYTKSTQTIFLRSDDQSMSHFDAILYFIPTMGPAAKGQKQQMGTTTSSTSIVPSRGKPAAKKTSAIPAPKSQAQQPQKQQQHTCEICDTQLADMDQYRCHLQQAHEHLLDKTVSDMVQDAQQTCGRCRERFWTYEGLDRHEVMSHGLVTLNLLAKDHREQVSGYCKLCGKSYDFDIIHHLITEHQGKLCNAEIMYSCDKCSFRSASYQKLGSHRHLAKKHHSKNMAN